VCQDGIPTADDNAPSLMTAAEAGLCRRVRLVSRLVLGMGVLALKPARV
jgi:hypothetical protein